MVLVNLFFQYVAEDLLTVIINLCCWASEKSQEFLNLPHVWKNVLELLLLLSGLHSLLNIKMNLIFQNLLSLLYIVFYLYPVELWKHKQDRLLSWVENEILVITLKDKTGNVILNCPTQNEVMVSKARAQPRSEFESKQRAGTLPASGSRAQLSLNSSFVVHISRAEWVSQVCEVGN